MAGKLAASIQDALSCFDVPAELRNALLQAREHVEEEVRGGDSPRRASLDELVVKPGGTTIQGGNPRRPPKRNRKRGLSPKAKTSDDDMDNEGGGDGCGDLFDNEFGGDGTSRAPSQSPVLGRDSGVSGQGIVLDPEGTGDT